MDVVDVRGKRRRLNAEALRRREGQGKGENGYRHVFASLRLRQSPFSCVTGDSNLLEGCGRLPDALDWAGKQISVSRKAGVGAWTQLSGEAQYTYSQIR